MRELPGVEAATVAQTVPLDLGGGSDFGVAVDGYTPTPDPVQQSYRPDMILEVKTSGDPLAMVGAVQGVVQRWRRRGSSRVNSSA